MKHSTLSLRLLMGFILTVSSGPGFPSSGTEPKRWDFRVFLDDKEIGYHTVKLTQDASGKRIEVAANFDVKFLFITAFSYEHTANELWRNDCLSRIETKTVSNGEEEFVRSNRIDNGIQLKTHQGEQTVTGCLRSFAYWNPELLKTDALLNTQTGEIEETQLNNVGIENIKLEGVEMPANRYALLAGGKQVDLWYTPEGDWLQLQSRVKGNRLLSYYRRNFQP